MLSHLQNCRHPSLSVNLGFWLTKVVVHARPPPAASVSIAAVSNLFLESQCWLSNRSLLDSLLVVSKPEIIGLTGDVVTKLFSCLHAQQSLKQWTCPICINIAYCLGRHCHLPIGGHLQVSQLALACPKLTCPVDMDSGLGLQRSQVPSVCWGSLGCSH